MRNRGRRIETFQALLSRHPSSFSSTLGASVEHTLDERPGSNKRELRNSFFEAKFRNQIVVVPNQIS